MKYTEITFKTPEENLAYDEALLDLSEEENHSEILRFWEPGQYFVVLGYSGKVSEEVKLNACQKENIPVLRRSSGGGTVLQGPGCLNFSLILDTQNGRPLKNLVKTNQYVMGAHQKTLQTIVHSPIQINGITDLTINGLKFSGNAQRRKKRFLLFHGSFLLRFDFSKIEKFLTIPKKQPEYRNNRTHQDFLMNLEVPKIKLIEAIRKIWKADQAVELLPKKKMEDLILEKYSNPDWNFKF